MLLALLESAINVCALYTFVGDLSTIFRFALRNAARDGATTALRTVLLWGGIQQCYLDSSQVLHYAVRYGNYDTAKMLITTGATISVPDVSQMTPLRWAARVGDLQLTQLMVDAGALVHDDVQHGDTALHEAVRHGHEAVVKLLLDAGADVAVGRPDQPLHVAAAFSPRIAQILIDAGADVSAAGAMGDTPLVRAKCSEEATKILLDAGASMETSGSYDGQTVLQHAVLSRCLGTVRLMLDAGADKDAGDN